MFRHMNSLIILADSTRSNACRWEVQIDRITVTLFVPQRTAWIVEGDTVQEQQISFISIHRLATVHCLPEGCCTISLEPTDLSTFSTIIFLNNPVLSAHTATEDLAYFDIKWERDIVHQVLISTIRTPVRELTCHMTVLEFHYAINSMNILNRFSTTIKVNLSSSILTFANQHHICIQLYIIGNSTSTRQPCRHQTVGLKVIRHTHYIWILPGTTNNLFCLVCASDEVLHVTIIVCRQFYRCSFYSCNITTVNPVIKIGKTDFVGIQSRNRQSIAIFIH